MERSTQQASTASLRSRILALGRVALLLALVLLALGVFARDTELLDRLFIYFPQRELDGTPTDVGLEFEDVSFAASDGVTLHGWFVPGPGETTVLWLHGNAGNISHRLGNLVLLRDHLEASVFIFDYRGYGRSQGSPSEQGIYLDAQAALDYLRSRPDVDSDRLVLFGRSLGASVAVELASHNPVHAVILETPFTSIKALAKRVYPGLASVLPLGVLVNSRYDALSRIGDVRAPVMVLHGDQDEIVPLEMGREVFDAASEPKRFYTIRGAHHNDTYVAGGEPYFQAMRDFVRDAGAGQSSGLY